jgi:hypothetical protein
MNHRFYLTGLLSKASNNSSHLRTLIGIALTLTAFNHITAQAQPERSHCPQNFGIPPFPSCRDPRDLQGQIGTFWVEHYAHRDVGRVCNKCVPIYRTSSSEPCILYRQPNSLNANECRRENDRLAARARPSRGTRRLD